MLELRDLRPDWEFGRVAYPGQPAAPGARVKARRHAPLLPDTARSGRRGHRSRPLMQPRRSCRAQPALLGPRSRPGCVRAAALICYFPYYLCAMNLAALFGHAGGAPWDFVLGLFHLRGMRPVRECVQEADRLGVPYVILEQTRRFDLGLVWRAYRVVRAHGITLLQSHSYKGHLLSLLLRPLTGLPKTGASGSTIALISGCSAIPTASWPSPTASGADSSRLACHRHASRSSPTRSRSAQAPPPQADGRWRARSASPKACQCFP
jgi:hypothetical protein